MRTKLLISLVYCDAHTRIKGGIASNNANSYHAQSWLRGETIELDYSM